MLLRLSFLSRPPVLLAIALVATILAYLPGLHGNFVFDDQYTLTMSRHVQLKQLDLASLRATAFATDAGPLKRPLSMLSFGLNHYFAGGMDPYSFKLVNLGIHVLNGISLYVLLAMLLTARAGQAARPGFPGPGQYLALAVTAIWLLHPLALTSVLYVAQRMNSLATLFTLWGLIAYVRGRWHMDAGRENRGLGFMVLGIVGGGALASLSKENGVLLPFYALVIEAAVYRFRTALPSGRNKLLALFGVVALAPLLVTVIYVGTHPEWLLRPYEIRSFTLTERLMTESRVLWTYLKWIVAPSNIELGLFHDDIPVSTGLLQPVTTLVSILGLGLLLAAAFLARNRWPWVTLGILWFLVGHSLESSAIALELVHEHRNYLPMVGILLIVVQALFTVGTRAKLARLPAMATVIVVLLFGVVTTSRAAVWGNNMLLYLTEVEHHPNSSRLNYELGRQYALLFDQDKNNKELYSKAQHHLQRSAELERRSTTGLTGLVFLAHMNSRPPEPAVLNELQRRLGVSFISAFDVISLDRLAGAQGQDKPILPHAEITALFDAVLENPSLNAVTRGMVLSVLSSYYANQRHAYADAAMLALKAIEVAPNEAVFNVSFASLLIATHQLDAAREQLRIAHSKDRLGEFALDIAAHARKIEELGRKGPR